MIVKKKRKKIITEMNKIKTKKRHVDDIKITSCVKARLLYTGYDEPPQKEVYILFSNKIISVSKKKPKHEIDRVFDVITPGFIDPHSHIGLERGGEPVDQGETNEHMESILTLVDSLDSVQMDDKLFKRSVEAGVLYSCVLPGSGNIIGGKSAVIRNYGENTTEAFIKSAGIKAAFGYNPMSTTDWKGTRPNTRMGAFAILRKTLLNVRDKLKKAKKHRKGKRKKTEDALTAEEKIIADLLTGKERLRSHVHKSDDVAALLRLLDEFKLKTTVEHASDVHNAKTFNTLKKRGINVVYGPLDSFPYKVELKHEDWRNIRYLIESRVEFGLMSDHPVIMQYTLPLTLRWFMRMGVSKQKAISIITYQNAKILEMDKMLGTLENGKWASFVGWNGDPFCLENYPVAVYGEGRLLHKE